MIHAVARAIAIPIVGQPEANAASGIQRLAPMAEPAMAQAFQENRFDVLALMLLRAYIEGERRAGSGTHATVMS